MPTDETTVNPYLDVVNEVWENRDSVKQARKDLEDAKKANSDKLDDELKVIADARTKLDEARKVLNERENAAHEARRQADAAASAAFRDAVGDYEERVYF